MSQRSTPSGAGWPPATRQSAGSSYGVLSWLQKDNIYWFHDQGFMFTTPWVVTQRTVRHHATLLLTTSGDPFELNVRGRTLPLAAAGVAPLTPRGLCARDLGLISVHVGIRHPCFPAFGRIPQPGVLGLDRGAFGSFDGDLVRAYEGRLDHAESEQLFEGLVSTAVAQLPAAGRSDPRWDLVHELLHENPATTLGDVARRLDVSYSTASTIVSHALGVPLRAYKYGRRCDRAAKRLMSETPLTRLALDVGFTDSAHLTRSWQRSFGHPPSYARDSRHVRVVV